MSVSMYVYKCVYMYIYTCVCTKFCFVCPFVSIYGMQVPFAASRCAVLRMHVRTYVRMNVMQIPSEAARRAATQ